MYDGHLFKINKKFEVNNLNGLGTINGPNVSKYKHLEV